jgi:hypothetical protein
MASASTRKQCANGNGCKQTGVAHCEGCSQMFCGKHFYDHRRLLDEELNIIFSGCNEIKDTLNQQTVKPETHPLIKKVDEWEKKSIATIQQRAKELRQQLLQSGADHRNELSQKLRQLSEQSNEAREHESFSETDLRQWKKALVDLKAALASPSTSSIDPDDNFPLIHNISINLLKMTEDVFEVVSGNRVRIEENGKLIIHHEKHGPVEIRGKNQYVSGMHKIRLYIEESYANWMLLGINCKSTSLQNNSYDSKSTYGWSNNNCIWLNGQEKPNNSNVNIEIDKGDVISLMFDCDKRTIMMINERTNNRFELPVNITNCPFPWQLHINLFGANSRVRILSN